MSTTGAITETLLDAEPGDQLALEAEAYAWAEPFTVADVDEAAFENGNGGWRARELVLEAGHPRGSDRTIVAIEGTGAPDAGSTYGRLTAADPVDSNGEPQSEPGDRLDPPGRLCRPAPEIVETAPGATDELDLATVLDVVEAASTIQTVYRALPIDSYARTMELLWELDLKTEGSALRSTDELEDWIAALRDHYDLESR